MILKNALNHGGRLYSAGEDIRGKVPPDMLELLLENGHVKEAEEEAAAETDADHSNGNDLNGSDPENKPGANDPTADSGGGDKSAAGDETVTTKSGAGIGRSRPGEPK